MYRFNFYVPDKATDMNLVNSIYFSNAFRSIGVAITRLQYSIHKWENYFRTRPVLYKS